MIDDKNTKADFEGFEGLDEIDDEVEVTASSGGGRDRVWLYLGLFALLSAVLLRLLLAPV